MGADVIDTRVSDIGVTDNSDIAFMLLMKLMVLLLPMVNVTITDNADDVSFIHVDNATLITTDTSFDVTDNFVDTGDNYSTDNLAYDTYYQESMGSCHYLSEEGTCSSDNESSTGPKAALALFSVQVTLHLGLQATLHLR